MQSGVLVFGRQVGLSLVRRAAFVSALLFALTGILAAAGVGLGNSATAHAAETIAIGSGNFSEPQILAEMVRLLLEKNTNVKVRHVRNFGGSSLLHRAFTSGDIQMYISYTGTQFTGVLGMTVTDEWKDPDKVYQFVKAEYGKRFDATVFPSFGFQDTYAVAVRRATAEKYNLKAVSDLRPYAPQMTIGTDQTFQERKGDGFAEFVELYGLEFKRTVSMDYGLMYRAAGRGQVDAIVAYSTDARIKKEDLVTLKDDKQFFPPYDAVLFTRNDVVRKYNLGQILEPLLGLIDEVTMVELNYQADAMGLDPEMVARRFLQSKGLL
ncbi:MAG: glycine betaine ABC transporter substrate-binding protein [Bacteroidota bacterium]